MKKVIVLVLVLAMCLSAVGCGNTDKPADTGKVDQNSGENVSKDPSTEGIDKEQYYNTYLASEPTTLDVSLRSDSYSSTIIINVMEGLVRLEDRNGEYFMAPGDAQSWESNEEGTVWTFHLGDNKWSDGKAVTAQDYVYSLQRSADPNTGCPNGWFLSSIVNYDAISKGEKTVADLGVKAIDEKTLEITLANTTPAFLEICNASIYYPQREDKVKEWGEKYGTEPEYTIYNGPYVLESWVHNSKLVLKKNSNYWNAANVKLDTVNLSIMNDINTIINSYRSGDIDAVTVSSQEWLDEFKADAKSKYEYYTTQSMTYIFFNTKDDVFQNAKIRKAATLSIDREDINEMCFGGLRVPTYGWVVPTISVGETKFRDAAGDVIKEQLAELQKEGKTPKDLLIEGMKELNLGDDPSKLKVKLSLAGTDDWFRTFGEYLQQVFMSELGVTLEIDFAEWGIFYDNVQNGNYQMGYMSWGAYYNDPYDVLSVFYSEWDQAETGWGNKQYDELLDKGTIEMDEAKRIEYFKEAERLLLDDAVAAPLATSTSHSFYRNFVYGYSNLGFSANGYKDMYIQGR